MAAVDGVRVGVLTVSDTCSRKEAEDKSGPLLAELAASSLGSVVRRDCVEDNIQEIRRVLVSWADSKSVDIIFTTGGTGFAERDVTPEATLSILEKQAPGIVQVMLSGSLAVTPLAALARPAAGVRGNTIIVNMPGSCKAVRECYGFVQPVLSHAVDLIKGRKGRVVSTHTALQGGTGGSVGHTCPHHASHQERGVGDIAGRARQSPYPMISVDTAQGIVLEECRKALVEVGNVFVLGIETISFTNSLGRVLCEDVLAADPLPPFPASIKDGYAVVASDGAGVRTVRGESSAGYDPNMKPLVSGEIVRINTGAPVPPGSDAVVMVEDTKLVTAHSNGEEDTVEILSTPKPGLDIRPIGSDISKGEKVLDRGTLLGAGEIGVLAAVGAVQVAVGRLPVVAVLSTGNEIQPPGEDLLPGQVRDSNKTTLTSLLHQNGFPSVDCGIAKDDVASLTKALRDSLEKGDLLVTTGGVSMGDRDLLRQVLVSEFGATIHFARVNMKPGKPTTFATCHFGGKTKFILGLPGNPVSATVTCHLYVLPACRLLAGQHSPLPGKLRSRVSIRNPIRLDPRPEYQRVQLRFPPGSSVGVAEPTGNQISSRLTSVATANGLLILPGKTETVQEITPGWEGDFEVLLIGRL